MFGIRIGKKKIPKNPILNQHIKTKKEADPIKLINILKVSASKDFLLWLCSYYLSYFNSKIVNIDLTFSKCHKF